MSARKNRDFLMILFVRKSTLAACLTNRDHLSPLVSVE